MKKTKVVIWEDIGPPMFTATLLTIIEIRKQPDYPPINEQIKKRWGVFMYMMDYCSAVKKE